MPQTIDVLRAEAVEAILADLTDGVAAVNTAGTTQVAAVNAAGASAVGAVAGSVAAAASSATSAQASATNAGNYAAQANFSGYTGTFATRAAFGSPSGKAAGVYLVLADETYSGQPRAILVVSNAISAQWGVVLQNGAQGVDLIGPVALNQSQANNRTVARLRPLASSTAAGVPDFTWHYAQQNNPDGTSNDVGYFGWNAGGATAPNQKYSRLVFENEYHPNADEKWAETYFENRDAAGNSVRPLFIVFDYVTGRNKSVSFATDEFQVYDGNRGNLLMQRLYGVWDFAESENIVMRRNGSLLSAGVPGGERQLVSWYGADTSDQGTVRPDRMLLGDFFNAPEVWVDKNLQVGNIDRPGTKLRIHTNSGQGDITNLIELRTPGGNTDGGVAFTFGDSGTPSARFGFRNGVGFFYQTYTSGVWTDRAYFDNGGNIFLATAGGNLNVLSPDGLVRRKIGIDNSGNVVATA